MKHRKANMKLVDVVASLICGNERIMPKDIENTVLYLVSDSVLDDVRVLRRIAKKINETVVLETQTP
jgi:hypothetical protein